MDSETIARAAEIYAEARLKHVRIDSLDEKYIPREEGDGYAIQDKLLDVYEQRGMGPVVGYKVGLVSEDIRKSAGGAETLGLDTPVYGGIPERHLHIGVADLPFQEKTRTFVEGEFAVRISKDVPADAAPFDQDSIQEYVGACCAGMEIVEWAVDYWNIGKPNGPAMIADGSSNIGGVFSTGVEDWRKLDVASLHAVMLHDGKEVSAGYGRDLQGHPFEVLAWMAGHMIKHGRTLHAGDHVLLGSVTISYGEFEKGSEIIIRWDEIGEVKAIFR